MSAELISFTQSNAEAYRMNHVLLKNATTTTAGNVAQAAITGKYLLSIRGSFGTAATVSIFIKRASDAGFVLLRSLDTDAVAQYTKEGDVALSFASGDAVYAQLSGISGTVNINVNLSFLGK